jgi:uncharacterized membrane protein YkoI
MFSPMSPLTSRSKATVAAAVLGAVVSFGAVAGAATTKPKTTTTKKSSKKATKAASGADHGPGGNPNETALTGDTLAQAKAAAEAAVSGATFERASTEDPSDSSGAAYEVHMAKSDGTEVEVLQDKDFKVIATNTDKGHGRRGDHGGRGPAGNPNETPLTGDTLSKAKAAAEAAVSGGTAEGASTEDPSDASGAAYEVHVRKSDGSEVKVLEDKDFKVIATQADRGHGHH